LTADWPLAEDSRPPCTGVDAMPEPNHPPIVEWLEQRGYSEIEIAKILKHLEEHDHQTISDAVFDSIGRGSMTIDDIIKRALAKD
jgi:hypothetical protein